MGSEDGAGQPPRSRLFTAGQIALLPDDDDLLAGLTGRRRRRRGERLMLDGRRLERWRPARRVRAGLPVVDDAPVAPEVSVRDHIAAVVPVADADARIAAAPLLAGRGQDPAGVLSGGERRVLAWLVADLRAPRAVVLDRAATGLDRAVLPWAHRQVDRWLAAGVVVLVRAGRDEEVRWVHADADGRPRAAGH